VSIQQMRTRRGRIVAFDEPVGLGTLVDDADGTEHPFHCTAIGDGTRDIAVGVAVVFRLAASRHGRTEATDIWQVSI
jgi:cold shock CspA family protein